MRDVRTPLPNGLRGDAAWFMRQVNAHYALLSELPSTDRRRVAVRYALELDTRPILKPVLPHWICKDCLYGVARSVKQCPHCGGAR